MSKERDKGKRGELEVVALAQEHGFPEARRSGDAGQWDGDVDDVVEVVPDLRLSVKRQERLRLDAWSREVEARASSEEMTAVAYRRSREPWRVSIPLGLFFDLLRGYYE